MGSVYVFRNLMEPSSKTFGEWLRAKRKLAGLSQQAVSDRAKNFGTTISKQYVSNLERNAAHPTTGALPSPTLKKVDALAGAVGAPIPEARLMAGFAPPDTSEGDVAQARLLFYFNDLAEAARADALAMIEGFWRSQQARQKAEKHSATKRKSA
jgi:transcriptional regulator with XRE-family HTH domain